MDNQQGPLDVQRRLVGIDRLDGLADREAQFHQHQADAVKGMVGERRENQKLPELEEGLVKDSPFDPEVDAPWRAGSSPRRASGSRKGFPGR